MGLWIMRMAVWMGLALAVWWMGLTAGRPPAASGEERSRVLFLEIFRAATLEEARSLRAGRGVSIAGRFLGAVREEDLRKEFREAVRDLVDGQWSDAISCEGGYAVLRLLTPQEVAARKFPKGSPAYYVELGWAYGERFQYAKEIEAYRKAMDLDPDLVEAYVNLGEALRMRALSSQKEKGEDSAQDVTEILDEAIETLKVAIRLDPGLPEAHYNLALAYIAQNLPGLAVLELEEAIRLKPQETAFQKSLVSALILEGQCARAAREMEKVRKLGIDMEAIFRLWESRCVPPSSDDS